MVYIIQQLMIMKYLYKIYPLPELVYIFCLNKSRVSLNLLYITIDEN